MEQSKGYVAETDSPNIQFHLLSHNRFQVRHMATQDKNWISQTVLQWNHWPLTLANRMSYWKRECHTIAFGNFPEESVHICPFLTSFSHPTTWKYMLSSQIWEWGVVSGELEDHWIFEEFTEQSCHTNLGLPIPGHSMREK